MSQGIQNTNHCVFDWIGLRSRCEGQSIVKTGLYFEDQAQVHRKEINNTQGQDHLFTVQLLEQHLLAGWDRVKQDLIKKLGSQTPAIIFNYYNQQLNIGKLQGVYEEEERTAPWGIRVKRPDTCGGVDFVIPTIRFRPLNTGIVTLKITDGVKTLTEVIDVCAGVLVEFELNWIINGNNTYITLYDNIFEKQTLISDCDDTCNPDSNFVEYIDFYQFREDNAYQQSCNSANGIEIEIEAFCNLDKMLCPLYRQLGRQVLYAQIIDHLTYRQNVHRTNAATGNIETTQQQIASYSQLYNNEFNQQVIGLKDFFRKKYYNCFKCNQWRSRYVCM